MKRFVLFFLVTATLLNACICFGAERPEAEYRSLAEITNEELMNCALNLSKEILPDLELTTGEMIPIYDQAMSLIGYSIEYLHGKIPYGYVNLDFRKENPIADFSIEMGSIYLHDALVEHVDDTFTREAQLAQNNEVFLEHENEYDDCIYNLGQGLYGVSVAGASEICVPVATQSLVRLPVTGLVATEYPSLEYNSASSIYTSSYTGTVVKAPTYIEQYSRAKSIIRQDAIVNLTGRYACAVLALTEIANQENILQNGSIEETFLTLWDYTMTYDSVTNSSDDVQYGSTDHVNIGPGMDSYVSAQGGYCTPSVTRNAPFSFFTSMVNDNKSGVLSYVIDIVGGISGHAVNVFGYCVTQVDGVTANYLIVADGWNTGAPRYICYSDTDFNFNYGIAFTIL